jgi:hypothetical protein
MYPPVNNRENTILFDQLGLSASPHGCELSKHTTADARPRFYNAHPNTSYYPRTVLQNNFLNSSSLNIVKSMRFYSYLGYSSVEDPISLKVSGPRAVLVGDRRPRSNQVTKIPYRWFLINSLYKLKQWFGATAVSISSVRWWFPPARIQTECSLIVPWMFPECSLNVLGGALQVTLHIHDGQE